MSTEDRRLVRVSKICAGLPEATREISGRHATFRVRKKTFAYFLDDHQGDGIVGVVFKAQPGEQEPLLETYPERFYMPAYIGHHGWIGIHLDRGKVDWVEVGDFVADSYLLIAPKRLGAQVEAGLPRRTPSG